MVELDAIEFSKLVYRKLESDTTLSTLEAMTEVVEEYDIDLSNINKLLIPKLKVKLETEVSNSRMLKSKVKAASVFD